MRETVTSNSRVGQRFNYSARSGASVSAMSSDVAPGMPLKLAAEVDRDFTTVCGGRLQFYGQRRARVHCLNGTVAVIKCAVVEEMVVKGNRVVFASLDAGGRCNRCKRTATCTIDTTLAQKKDDEQVLTIRIDCGFLKSIREAGRARAS